MINETYLFRGFNFQEQAPSYTDSAESLEVFVQAACKLASHIVILQPIDDEEAYSNPNITKGIVVQLKSLEKGSSRIGIRVGWFR